MSELVKKGKRERGKGRETGRVKGEGGREAEEVEGRKRKREGERRVKSR